MSFQSTVNLQQAYGVPGEILYDGPVRAQALNINSADASYNIIGATAFTTSDGVSAAAGGTIGNGVAFAGILANPKVYATAGTTSGALAPTLTLPNNGVGEFLFMGEMVVTLPAAAAIGDSVLYDTTTGALSTMSPNTVGTATQSTTTLTVVTPASGNIGVGSVVTIAGAQPVRVLALGTGTGGAGTYTVDVSQTVSPAAAIVATNVAPSGKAFVPHASVDRLPPSGAGLGVIKLTN